MAKVVPWERIKTEYLTSEVSVRELAEKYGCSISTLSKKCTAEGWRQAKRDADEAMVSAAVRERQKKARESLEALVDVADLISDRLVQVLHEAEKAMNARELQAAAAALKSVADTYRAAGQIPTVAEAETRKVNAERLAIERKRLALEEAKAKSNDGGVEIVLAGEAEKYGC